ncbi:MAG: RsmB/NOP family class I SAM-dependent RNA methyltransferase [Burkholderiales bacterium]|nr:RsmB/NOP family class I SAM-dependent RNA methyltransferase [Burkholderiales bacterium]
MSKFEQPSDVLLSKHFANNRKLKPFERNAIAETIYTILRNFYKLSDIGLINIAQDLIIYTWIRLLYVPLKDLDKLNKIKFAHISKLPKLNDNILELPDWILQKISRYMNSAEIKELDNAMSSLAPLTLRVNTVKINRADLLSKFAELKIEAFSTKFSPYAITLSNKSSLMKNKLFLDGYFEVQDEASQLATLLLDAKRSEMVVDFCAGSGGKTLMLGMMMRNSGRLYAFDVNERRLGNMRPRLARSGLSNVYAQVISNENDTKIKRLAGKVDKVFIDAPCLGLGTIRRNPDLKMRQQETSIDEMNQTQLAILQSASRLLKPKGLLVYATCSILHEENRDVIDKFLLENQGFEIVKISEQLQINDLKLNDDRYLELFPHIHGTDGFFACVLRKV